MPRPPNPAPTVAEMPGAVFSRIAHKIRAHEGPIYPLHVGDTYLEPFVGGRMQDLSVEQFPGMHRYTSPQGLPQLISACVDKVRRENGLSCERDNVIATAGATGGLAAAIGMLAAPGEEILILSPFWPLIRGIVETFRATPVEVPFFGVATDAASAVEVVRAKLTERTVALYVSTPSNPTGKVIPPDWLEALAALCHDEDLWLLSDEIYDRIIFRGEHASVGVFAPKRTLSVFSFSKAYGMAGNRTGYVVGPRDVIASCRKISTHTFYSAPTSGQLAGIAALRDGEAWLEDVRARYHAAGDAAADVLGVPRPEGSTFLFLDVSRVLDERGVFGFLEDCLDQDGVLLAPGPSFGSYPTHVRVCFTSAPPGDVDIAARKLAKRLR